MGSFDEYRKRWIYFCPACEAKITAFRDCGENSPCRCGASMFLDKVIEPKHIEDTPSSFPAVHVFKPYFDVTMGKEVTSKREINEYCKRNNMVYAGDKELTQQCAQNKRENAIKQDRAFVDGLAEKLGKVI